MNFVLCWILLMVLWQRKMLPTSVLPILPPGLPSSLPPHLPPQTSGVQSPPCGSVSLLLSQQSSERRKRRNWVNSPELVAVTDSLLLSDSAHSPMFVWVFHYRPPFPLPPLCSPLLFWSLIISIHTISFALNLHGALLYSALFLFSHLNSGEYCLTFVVHSC